MSATPKENVQKGFRPLVPGFVFGELNNLESFASAGRRGHRRRSSWRRSRATAGSTPARRSSWSGLRRLCDENNLLLLLDEVQCGVGPDRALLRLRARRASGRTRSRMAKGLGGGFPIGAMWVGERSADLFQPGIARVDLRRHAARVRRGARRPGRDRARGAAGPRHPRERALDRGAPARWPGISRGTCSGVRGLGFLVGVQMARDSAPYAAALRERGLLTALGGRQCDPPAAAPQRLRRGAGALGGDRQGGPPGSLRGGRGWRGRFPEPRAFARRWLPTVAEA